MPLHLGSSMNYFQYFLPPVCALTTCYIKNLISDEAASDYYQTEILPGRREERRITSELKGKPITLSASEARGGGRECFNSLTVLSRNVLKWFSVDTSPPNPYRWRSPSRTTSIGISRAGRGSVASSSRYSRVNKAKRLRAVFSIHISVKPFTSQI